MDLYRTEEEKISPEDAKLKFSNKKLTRPSFSKNLKIFRIVGASPASDLRQAITASKNYKWVSILGHFNKDRL